MVNEIIELDSFIVHRPTLVLGPVGMDMYNTNIYDVLSGKYHVLKHVASDDGDTRCGSLFLVHSDFASKLDLQQYDWQPGDKFYGSTTPIAIMNQLSKHDDDISEKLCDNLVQVIDNSVCFSIINNSTWKKYEIVKHDNFIIAIKVDNIGAYINTPNRQLVDACQRGYFEKVKKLLTSGAADIAYESYAPFDAAMEYAKVSGDATIMKYLLMSDELTVHTDVTCARDSELFHLFDTHKNIVNDLIYELPIAIVHNIQNLYEDYSYTHLQNEELEHAFNVRILANNLDNELPKHNNKSRKSKI